MKQIIVEHYPIRAVLTTGIQAGEMTSFDQIPDTVLRVASKKDGKLRSLYIKLSKFDDVKDTDLSTQFASSIVAEKLVALLEEAIVKERLFGEDAEENQFDYSVHVNAVGGTYPIHDDESGQLLKAEDARRRWMWNSSNEINNQIAGLLSHTETAKPGPRGGVQFNPFAQPTSPTFEISLMEPQRPNQSHGIRINMRHGTRVTVVLEPKEVYDTNVNPYQNSYPQPFGTVTRDVDIQLRNMDLTAKINIAGFPAQESKHWFTDETLKALVLEMATSGLAKYINTLSSFNFGSVA
jgi:hypothetical protein